MRKKNETLNDVYVFIPFQPDEREIHRNARLPVLCESLATSSYSMLLTQPCRSLFCLDGSAGSINISAGWRSASWGRRAYSLCSRSIDRTWWLEHDRRRNSKSRRSVLIISPLNLHISPSLKTNHRIVVAVLRCRSLLQRLTGKNKERCCLLVRVSTFIHLFSLAWHLPLRLHSMFTRRVRMLTAFGPRCRLSSPATTLDKPSRSTKSPRHCRRSTSTTHGSCICKQRNVFCRSRLHWWRLQRRSTSTYSRNSVRVLFLSAQFTIEPRRCLESIILKTVDCETIDLYNQMVKSNDSCVAVLPPLAL